MLISRLHASLLALTASAMFLSHSALAAPIPATPGNNMLYDIRTAANAITYVGGGDYGLKFTITAPLTVTSLGIWDMSPNGFAESHQVGLWNSSSTLLASATIDDSSTPVASSSIDGQWMFHTLSQPITLPSGTYTLGFYNTAGFDEYYRISGNDLSFQTGANFSNGVWQFARSFAMPTTDTALDGFAGPNLQGTFAVPEVGSIVMGSIGAAGLLLAVRRRRNGSMAK